MILDRSWVLLLACFAVVGCDGASTDVQIATLYRNSILDPQMRIHVGTFDANEKRNTYNIQNCEMTSRLLNANVQVRSTKSTEQEVGFWCEPGDYEEKGLRPFSFDAEFPTDTP